MKTGIKTYKGVELKLGDVLSSDWLLDTVVVKDDEGLLHAQVVSEPFIAFDLEQFLRENKQLDVTDNIDVTTRSKKKIFE
ncbi:hypothetical protein P9X10_01285 [Bacillus cereus]|nr:hypothetical protein [Bacillus cereus]